MFFWLPCKNVNLDVGMLVFCRWGIYTLPGELVPLGKPIIGHLELSKEKMTYYPLGEGGQALFYFLLSRNNPTPEITRAQCHRVKGAN